MRQSSVHRLRGVDIVTHCVASHHHPAPASAAVNPQFARCPAGITTHQQVLCPLIVAAVASWPWFVRIADVLEFGI